MYLFDKDIDFILQESNRHAGQITPNWSINGNPNGGYLLAILAKTMMSHSDKKETPILTANFIAKCRIDPADILVEEIIQSRQFSRFQARLLQDGTEKVRAFGTFANLSDECGLTRYETNGLELADIEDCIEIPPLPNYTIYDHLEARLDPGCGGWMSGKLTEKSEHKGWMRFRDGRPFDMFSIALISDAFPPPVFASQGLVAWVPTIEFTLNIRSIPETKWVKCIFRTRFIHCGLLEEDGEIWDENDQLVAISRQIAQFKKIKSS